MAEFMTAIRRESDRFAEVLTGIERGVRVPTCPDWDADDLLWHLTEVHVLWARVLRDGAQTDADAEALEADAPQRPGDRAAVLRLFAQWTDVLLDELARRPDDDAAFFWLDTARTVGSTRRMQAHEATIHRVDAELAAGLPVSSIDPVLAWDGVRHAVGVMWAWWGTLDGFTFDSRGLVELRVDGLEPVLVEVGRWQGVGQSGKTYDVPSARLASSGTPAVTVSGTAEQLDLWLWGRGEEPAASGDDGVLGALREAREQGMP